MINIVIGIIIGYACKPIIDKGIDWIKSKFNKDEE